jgi:copper chaperone CopZ
MISNVIIIVVVLLIFSLSIKGTVSHFKGEGSCCGGGSKDVLVKPAKLNNIISVLIVRIEGMHCEHCYARVHNVLNSIEGVNAKVNGRKGEAIVKLERDMDHKVFEQAITDLGYKVMSITEK